MTGIRLTPAKSCAIAKRFADFPAFRALIMSMRVVCPQGHVVLVNASKLGGTAICPQCFASFLVELNRVSPGRARPEGGKSRRPRDDEDDDDDDEEGEERPRKKPSAKKAKDEDERPSKKAKTKKTKDDDVGEEEETPRRKKKPRAEEDETDDDKEEAKEPEEPIEWTPRKRQLNIGSNGLIAMMVGCYLLLAFTVFTSCWIDLYEFDVFDGGRPWTISLFYFFSVPLLYLGMTAFVVALVFNLAAPAKAGGRGAIISGLVFASLVYLLGLMALLTMLGVFVADPARAERFVQLLVGGSVVCFVIFMISTMAYLSKLMIFMRLHLDASQAITNIGFILLAFSFLLGLVFLSPTLKVSVGDWTRFIVAAIADLITGYLIYMLIVDANLIKKVRSTIAIYIKEG